MSKIETIVVATDFSEASARAVRLGSELSKSCDATLHLCYVVESAGAIGLYPSFRRAGGQLYGSDAHKRLEYIGESAAASGIRVLSDVVSSAYAAPGILAHADECDADLIVLGTRGRGVWRRAFLGSVAFEVIDHARRPVLVVPLDKKVILGNHAATVGGGLANGGNSPARPGESRPGPALTTDSARGPVIASLDLSVSAIEVLGQARALAEALGAAVEIVHVVQDQPSGDPEPDAVWFDKLQEVLGSGVTIEPSRLRVLYGEAGEELVALARRSGASSLVLGRTLRGGSLREDGGDASGSESRANPRSGVVRTVLSGAPCPILVVGANQ